MCGFFSAISNGKGKVLFFTIEQIIEIEKMGNLFKYNWNSHSSIAHYNGILNKDEDKYNKWEYDCENKKLNLDSSLVTDDDSSVVKEIIEKYLVDNNALFCQKIYKNNSGDCNSGDCNSGNCNSGNRNSGDYNSGNCNSGGYNSGDYNLGGCNSGDCNSGNCNSGNRNSGDYNSGNRNSGDYNSGNCNSGDYNSGNRNSGDYNSGNCNSGDYNSGFFNTNTPKVIIFNKETEVKNIIFPFYFNITLTKWIDFNDMTDKEKKQNPLYKSTEGFLREFTYKEAWINSFNNATKKEVEQTLKLPNFDYQIFEEITGITKEMIKRRLSV